jgi:hypothetical protein
VLRIFVRSVFTSLRRRARKTLGMRKAYRGSNGGSSAQQGEWRSEPRAPSMSRPFGGPLPELPPPECGETHPVRFEDPSEFPLHPFGCSDPNGLRREDESPGIVAAVFGTK